jgi:ATP-dependent 26S proteasome regulatory subunit
MHRFLNVSEGLVSIKGKKIIFSTNLPSVKDIDPALMRRGRCFDVIHFNAMSKENADKLADKLGIKYNIEDGKYTYTVAEIFSGERQSENKPVRQKFGFSV